MSGIESLKTNEFTKDLIVYDSDYLDSAAKYVKIGEALDKIYKSYLKALRECAEKNQGAFANGLSSYVEAAELLEDCFSEICKGLKSDMNDYITELDEADGQWV